MHYLEKAAVLCDRILIIDKGKIVEEGNPAELVKKYAGEEVLEVGYDEALLPSLKAVFPDGEFERLGDRLQIFTCKLHGVFEGYLKEHPLKNVTVRSANLEDVFLKLTGRGLREE